MPVGAGSEPMSAEEIVVGHVCHCVVATNKNVHMHVCDFDYLKLFEPSEKVSCNSSAGTAGCKHSFVEATKGRQLFFFNHDYGLVNESLN